MTLSRVGQPYSAEEREIIARLAGKRCTSLEIREALPERSPSAVRFAMNKHRKSIGIALRRAPEEKARDTEPQALAPDDPGLTCHWHKRHIAAMAASNARFVAAMAAA